MGGYFSGWGQRRDCTEDFLRLDVRWLHRKGSLVPGASSQVHWSRHGERFASVGVYGGFEQITLQYKRQPTGGEWQDKRYEIAIERTPCNLGGTRVWFRCPECGRRAAVLYSSRVFSCRRCLGLAYESQKEAPHYRALHKAQAIHEKLGGTGCTDDPLFKPKGMHWQTYRRYLARFEEAESRAVPPWLIRALSRSADRQLHATAGDISP